MITEITIKIINDTGSLSGGAVGNSPFSEDVDDEKLETKLNEVFDGLDKIDKMGIGSSSNPVPK